MKGAVGEVCREEDTPCTLPNLPTLPHTPHIFVHSQLQVNKPSNWFWSQQS